MCQKQKFKLNVKFIFQIMFTQDQKNFRNQETDPSKCEIITSTYMMTRGSYIYQLYVAIVYNNLISEKLNI